MGLNHAIITDPFDLSGRKVQAAIKRVPAAIYRKVIEANSEAQGLAVACGRLLSMAAAQGLLPNAEHNRPYSHVTPTMQQQAVDAISEAEHVLILGLGTSGSVAQELTYRLEWIGVNCGQYVDPHRQLMAATLLNQGDLAIAVSHSGRTKSVVNSLRLARERGAKTLCITDFPHSPITKESDICVCAVHAENSLGVEMVATRAAHLALVDCIAMCVALRNRERALRSIKLNERLLINLRY